MPLFAIDVMRFAAFSVYVELSSGSIHTTGAKSLGPNVGSWKYVEGVRDVQGDGKSANGWDGGKLA